MAIAESVVLGKRERVDAEEDAGYISPESDFYGGLSHQYRSTRLTILGDETVKQELEQQVNAFDAEAWWANKPIFLEEIADANIEALKKQEKATLYNPYKGLTCARQLEESVPEFLERIRPSKTSTDPWILIANPFRKLKSAGESRGGEGSSKGPANEDANWATFVKLGNSLLEQLTVVKNDIEKKNAKKPKAIVARAIDVEKEKIVKQILDTAVELRRTTGKWMVFCERKEVDEVWQVVAKATAEGDLGIGAKVAPFGGDNRGVQLMCVYTKDFSNLEDVKKVLQKMKTLGLVQTARKPIYYKCDAYTYLEIKSNNEYNIKASLYSSRDFLKTKSQQTKELEQGKLHSLLYKKKEGGDWKKVEWE
ncbi:hypothetical protein BJ875DRAFT_379371 [Amylocarpus encephaloides]|uniref:DUF1917-domain-containing protein n=1 Tax=Amylocarpus encephaloides TaxID=45428 RepID=A0A9P8C4D3_9HELO|nr:hypothetical protein BJ875DRAFT_379371 [Amylocarpus encephaloides]